MEEQTPRENERNVSLERDFPLGNYHKDEIYQNDKDFKKSVTLRNSEVFDLSIIKDTENNKINCGELGKLLDCFQGVIHSLALSRESKHNNVPEEIKENSNLVFSQTFRDPYTIRLIDSRKPSLFPLNELEMHGKEFVKLLSKIDYPEEIISKIQKYNNLTKKRFTRFLSVLVDSGFDIKVRWAVASSKYQDKKFITNRDNVKASLTALKKHQVEIANNFTYIGKLVGINIKNDFFALEQESGELMKGKLSKALKNQNFKIPSQVRAEILEHMEFSELTQSNKYHYMLLDIDLL